MASYFCYARAHVILGTETTKSVQGNMYVKSEMQIYNCFNLIPNKTETRAITSDQPQKTQVTAWISKSDLVSKEGQAKEDTCKCGQGWFCFGPDRFKMRSLTEFL